MDGTNTCIMPPGASITEPARRIAVTDGFDVVVVGGGMAGVAAAVAAARNGVRVCLVERYCALGGLATLGNVTIWLPLCDGQGTQVIGGLGEELLTLSVSGLNRDHVAARFRRPPDCWLPGGNPAERLQHRYAAAFNPAFYLLALEKWVVESGVRVLYDTRLCAVNRERNTVSHVIVENKSGRSALQTKALVDATGDADVCALTGERTLSLKTNVPAGWFYSMSSQGLRLHCMSRRYDALGGRDLAQGPFFAGDSAADVTNQILKSREIIRNDLSDFRKQHPDDDPQLIMPATMACLRMTRRLVGALSLADQHRHICFADMIGMTGDWRKAGPVYPIPLSCLSGVVNCNLLAAGRCLSVDQSIWDALRVIPPCVVTGEAAGTATALAVRYTDGNVQVLPARLLRKQLERQGVRLNPPGV